MNPIGRTIAAVGIAGAAVLLGAPTSSAGPEHNNTDPAKTGCNVDAYLASTRNIETESGQVVGQVEVYYSRKCQTNWIRVPSNAAGGAAVKDLWSDAGGETHDTDSGNVTSYSMQVYAPGATCIHYMVHLKYPDGRHYGETYEAGANRITVCGP